MNKNSLVAAGLLVFALTCGAPVAWLGIEGQIHPNEEHLTSFEFAGNVLYAGYFTFRDHDGIKYGEKAIETFPEGDIALYSPCNKAEHTRSLTALGFNHSGRNRELISFKREPFNC